MDRNFFARVGVGDTDVALRKESVDRNNTSQRVKQPWGVALRKESVDRNTHSQGGILRRARRSPQGERG